MITAVVHRSRIRGLVSGSGVARTVRPSASSNDEAAEVTRLRNQSLIALRILPPTSKNPGSSSAAPGSSGSPAGPGEAGVGSSVAAGMGADGTGFGHAGGEVGA